MKTAIAIRHVPFEDAGLLEAVLHRSGYRLHYREAGMEALDDEGTRQADLVIILGGPIGVYEGDSYPFLRDEIALARHRLDEKRPMLGICLGAQIMARAAGARVYPSGIKEIGWSPLTLTEAGRSSVLAPIGEHAVLHWHGDTFDLPPGADCLASTPLIAHQAFSIGRHALGLQFHLEAGEAGLERWYIGHACEIAGVAGVDVPDLRRQAEKHARALAPAAEAVFKAWLSGLDVR